MTQKLVNEIRTAKYGSHLCLLYNSPEEKLSAVLPFILVGLERGEKCICIDNEDAVSTVADSLRAEGVEVDAALKSGALTFAKTEGTYLKDGQFDPNRMIEFLLDESSKCKESGYAALRITGEMSWACKGAGGAERLVEYESIVNRVMQDNDVIALCQYDLNIFSPETILAVINTHPFIIYGDSLIKNQNFAAVDRISTAAHSAGGMMYLLDNLLKSREMEGLLRERESTLNDVLSCIGDSIAMLDRDLNIVWANETTYKMYGDNIVGRKCYEICYGKSEPCKPCHALKSFETGGFSYHLHEVKDKGGEIRYSYSFSNVIGRDMDGTPRTVVRVSRDVTSLRKYEAELLSSEKRYKNLFESSRDIIFTVSPDGTLLSVNRAGEEFTGWSQKDIVGRKFLTLVHHKERARARDIFRRVLLGEKTAPMEFRTITKEGEHRVAEVSATLVMEGEGVSVVIGIGRDVTARRLAEEALMESEERYRMLFENESDAVVVFDAENQIFEDANSAALELFGYSKEEFLRLKVTDISAEKDKTEAAVRSLKEEPTGVIKVPLRYMIKKDGTVFPVEISTGAYMSKGRRKLIGAIRDITERVRAEEEIIRAKNEWEHTFNAITDPVMVLDTKFRILRVNDAFARLTGIKSHELAGRFCHEVFHGTDEPIPGCPNLETLADGLSHEIEVYEKKFGKYFNVTSSPLIDPAGKLMGSVHYIRDITSQKVAMREREKLLYELERKNKELEQVMYVTSHDLRSPLVNVQGYTREIAYSVEQLGAAMRDENMPIESKEIKISETEEEINESGRYIQASVKKMSQLLSGLLRLSRSGREKLDIEEIDMNFLMSEVSASFDFQLKEVGAKLDISPALPPCLGDSLRINQVFSNLMDNAIKYLDPGRKGLIKVTGECRDGQSIFCVEDNGTGIDEKYHEKIFEIFQKLDPVEGTGEGLGLAVVSKILDRLGGKVWVESEKGGGSRFFVALPEEAGT